MLELDCEVYIRMSNLQGKPFPTTMYDEFSLKPKHYLFFWALYNDLQIGDEEFVFFTRPVLLKALREVNLHFQVTHLTSVLQSLAVAGYVEYRTGEDRSIGTGIQTYEIRIHPQAWTKAAPRPKPYYLTTEARQLRQEKYIAARRARNLAAKLA
jgi:hypothetical protein